MIGDIEVVKTKQIARALKWKLLGENCARLAKISMEKLSSLSESECAQSDCKESYLRTLILNQRVAVDYALKRLDQPSQWIIYLLHLKKLVFRHLSQHIDGSTSYKTFLLKIFVQPNIFVHIS